MERVAGVILRESLDRHSIEGIYEVSLHARAHDWYTSYFANIRGERFKGLVTIAAFHGWELMFLLIDFC